MIRIWLSRRMFPLCWVSCDLACSRLVQSWGFLTLNNLHAFSNSPLSLNYGMASCLLVVVFFPCPLFPRSLIWQEKDGGKVCVSSMTFTWRIFLSSLLIRTIASLPFSLLDLAALISLFMSRDLVLTKSPSNASHIASICIAGTIYISPEYQKFFLINS